MNQSKAKAFLAIIIAAVILMTALVMFKNQAMEKIYSGTIRGDNNTPEPEPEPYYEGQGPPSTPLGVVQWSNPGGGSPGSPAHGTDIPPQEDIQVATFTGYWGIINNPEPTSPLSGIVYAEKISDSGEFVHPWILLTGNDQVGPIYIRFSIEENSYQGYMSTQPDFDPSVTTTISGSFWQDTTNPRPFISFFSADASHWIYGNIQNTQGRNTLQGRSAFVYWGSLSDPKPLASLKGVVLAVANSMTSNVAHPWLNLKGPYDGKFVMIRYPISQPSGPFEGYISIPEPAVSVKGMIITGSQYHVSGGTGFCGAFFTWEDRGYFLLGTGYNLP
jgi:hypothetical protein